MHEPSSQPSSEAGPRVRVLELRVRNHPGAMSHITGLFARRAFNLESILCVPDSGDAGSTSTMLLGVADEPRLEQVERQLEKLHDVLEVRHRPDLAAGYFAGLLPRARVATGGGGD